MIATAFHIVQVNLDDLKDSLKCFNKAMEESSEYIDERKSGMTSMLGRNIKELRDKVQVTCEHAGANNNVNVSIPK